MYRLCVLLIYSTFRQLIWTLFIQKKILTNDPSNKMLATNIDELLKNVYLNNLQMLKIFLNPETMTLDYLKIKNKQDINLFLKDFLLDLCLPYYQNFNFSITLCIYAQGVDSKITSYLTKKCGLVEESKNYSHRLMIHFVLIKQWDYF